MEKIIFIASPNSQEIHIFKINQKKELEATQILHTPGRVQPMVIHPYKNILYAGIRPYPKIISFHIKNGGYLKKIKEFIIPSDPTHLNINETGTILYSVSYKDNSLSIIKIDDSGNCTSILQLLIKLMGCHSSNIEIKKQRLWIPCLKEDCVRLYKINKDGTLYENSLQKINTQVNSGPRHMVFERSYNYAYLIKELNSTVDVIKIHTSINYLPKIIQTINLLPKNYNHHANMYHSCWSADIHITPDNDWIYCSDRNHSIISYLRILENKKLQFKGYQNTELQPRGFAIDNHGKYLIAAGEKSNFVSIYEINKNQGKLTQLFRFPVGSGPMWINIIDRNNY